MPTNNNQDDFLGRDSWLNRRSERIEQIVDDEVIDLINSCYGKVTGLLQDKKESLIEMAEELLDKEVLQEEDVRRILD